MNLLVCYPFQFPLRSLVVLSAAALAACGAPAPKTAAVPLPASAPARVVSTVPQSPLSTAADMDSYKREIASWISNRSKENVYATQPQALLRGIVVLNIQIDAQGAVQAVRLVRSPGDRELEQRAIKSVWQASPLPRPDTNLTRGQRTMDFAETWLFNNDGRFQLRSIALTQKTTNF